MPSDPAASPSAHRNSPRFEWRASTVALVAAAFALATGVTLNSVSNRHFTDQLDFLSVALLYILFPTAAFTGTVAALVLLLTKRRLQFAIELALGVLYLLLFSTWEIGF